MTRGNAGNPRIHTTLESAIAAARVQERMTGQRRWVAGMGSDRGMPAMYEVVHRPPLLGDWWDTDGIQHGGSRS